LVAGSPPFRKGKICRFRTRSQDTSHPQHKAMEAHATPFLYPTEQLSSCATFLNNIPTRTHHPQSAFQDCRRLFLRHAAHYHRPALTAAEETFWNDANLFTTENTELEAPTDRIRAFLNSVQFLHRHNNEEGRHVVALNRFSDLTENELPIHAAATNGLGTNNESPLLHQLLSEEKPFIALDSEELILELSRKFRRRRIYSDHHDPSQQSILPPPTSSLLKQFYRGIFDSWWWIGERHDNNLNNDDDDDDSKTTTTAAIEEHSRSNTGTSRKEMQKRNSFTVEKNEIDGIEDYHDEVEDRWERYLNWSTEDNPDGVGIVHDAMDQVGVLCIML
jgi:hypothetical protein